MKAVSSVAGWGSLGYGMLTASTLLTTSQSDVLAESFQALRSQYTLSNETLRRWPPDSCDRTIFERFLLADLREQNNQQVERLLLHPTYTLFHDDLQGAKPEFSMRHELSEEDLKQHGFGGRAYHYLATSLETFAAQGIIATMFSRSLIVCAGLTALQPRRALDALLALAKRHPQLEDAERRAVRDFLFASGLSADLLLEKSKDDILVATRPFLENALIRYVSARTRAGRQTFQQEEAFRRALSSAQLFGLISYEASYQITKGM